MNLAKAFRYFSRLPAFYLPLRTRKRPTILSYLITPLCNSHCITCNVWRNTENKTIPAESLKETLKKDLFSEIRHVGISGGEPSLFEPLQEHIGLLLSGLEKIETLSITTNAIHSNFWCLHAEKIRDMCAAAHVAFQFNVSLDGIGEVHDKIRGTRGNFEKTRQMLLFLKKQKIPFQIHSTINRYNVYHLGAILHFAQELDADIIFRLASEIHRLNNRELIERVGLSPREFSFVCDFLSSEALLQYTRSPGRKLFYRHLVRQLLGSGKRSAPCYFKEEGLVLDSDGSLSFCSRFQNSFSNINSKDDITAAYFDRNKREVQQKLNCPGCYHDQTGFWPIHEVLAVVLARYISRCRKFLAILRYGILSCFTREKRNKKSGIPVTRVAIIGMYGGEHVGDAAILGGVITRLRRRHPELASVFVYSFRKDRTEGWVSGLTELQGIAVEVIGEDAHFVSAMKSCGRIVWGGGPLMELPLVLARNYYFICNALHLGIPFEVEGCGYGPVNSIFGRFLLTRILLKASRISVRSAEDWQQLISMEAAPIDESHGFRDPAFDYLAVLKDPLNLDFQEQKSVERILARTKERPLFALNLRPLWNRYGKNEAFDAENFLKQMILLVDALIERGFSVVFFAMNADQFGFCDWEVAYRLRERLKSAEYFHIWEWEPSVNGVLFLLRRARFALCMRFHAAAFSLSQNVDTFGIDYSLSGKGKVSTLFTDQERCLTLWNFRAEKVLDLMAKHG